MGVGGFYNQLSSDMKDLTSTVGIEIEDVWGTELYYNAEITPNFHLTADLQIIDNTNEADDTAFVLGLRGKIDL